jgi:hypothetical protein
MPRGRKQGRTKTVVDKDVLSLFQEALGDNSGGPTRIDIVAPKFQTLSTECQRFVNVVLLLGSSGMIREGLHLCSDVSNGAVLDAVHAYGKRLQETFDATFGAVPDLSPWKDESMLGFNFAAIPPDTRKAFLEGYSAKVRQENPLVQVAVATCKNLTSYRSALADNDDLNDGFLVRGAGGLIAPLDGLAAFNLKALYIALTAPPTMDGSDRAKVANARKMVLLCAHKLYVIGHNIYEGVLLPDIDPDEFTSVIAESIESVRRHIPRCDLAFDKILESTGTLKGNFSTYYKDYAASNDPTIILQNFVVDVSRDTKGSPELSRQFRTIIRHYRKLAGQRASDPRLQSLFGQINGSFGDLARADRDADEADVTGGSTGGATGGATNRATGGAGGAPTSATPTKAAETPPAVAETPPAETAATPPAVAETPPPALSAEVVKPTE